MSTQESLQDAFNDIVQRIVQAVQDTELSRLRVVHYVIVKLIRKLAELEGRGLYEVLDALSRRVEKET